jgi:hypothetical protein
MRLITVAILCFVALWLGFADYLYAAFAIAFVLCIFVFLPLALFHGTRKVSAYGLFISSVVFGLATCTFGFSITLFYWGASGVLVGLFLGIVGIVPVGVLASVFNTDWSSIGELAFGSVITVGARIIAFKLANEIDHVTPAEYMESDARQQAEEEQCRPEVDAGAAPDLIEIGEAGISVNRANRAGSHG